MSVCNLVVQRDAAYMTTDSGYFRADGTIVALEPKTITIGRLPLVIGVTGNGIAAAAVMVASSEADWGRGFTPNQFRDLVHAVYALEGFDPIAHRTRWALAYFDRAKGQAIGLTFFTHPDDGGDASPWQWLPVRVLVQPYVPPLEVFGDASPRQLTDPASFDPSKEAMKLVHAQRAKRDWDGVAGCAVAGQIRLSKVSAAGLEEFLIHEFADRVGEVAGCA